jgi:hypothetical protein
MKKKEQNTSAKRCKRLENFLKSWKIWKTLKTEEEIEKKARQ